MMKRMCFITFKNESARMKRKGILASKQFERGL